MNGPAQHVFLKPGEIIWSAEPLAVTTLLGSCVAVTLFNARLRFGAICHALLPSCRSEKPCCGGGEDAGKFVACAIMVMLREAAARGIGRHELEAKLFGGSELLVGEGVKLSVGAQNAAMALKLLERESVRLATRDLGGGRGRKLIFHAHTGEVYLKRLRRSEIDT